MSIQIPRDALHEFLIDGLKNAHAMESQAHKPYHDAG